jgi:hypothetical protein
MVGPLGALVACPAVATTIEVEYVDGAPLGVLSVFLAVATTEVGDVNGGPPEGRCRYLRQRPPPKLETSMVDPVLSIFPAMATTEVGDIDGGPLGGTGSMSGSGHHQETSMAPPP